MHGLTENGSLHQFNRSPHRLGFRLPLFAKFLLVLIPVFLGLSYVGLESFSRYDRRSQEEGLAARIGNQTARTAASLSRYPQAADTRLADDLLAPLAFDRAIVCVEWRAVEGQQLLAAFPAVIGCTGQKPPSKFALHIGEKMESILTVFFTDAELIHAAHVRHRFLLLVFGISFLVAVISASLGFQLMVGRRLGRLHAAIR